MDFASVAWWAYVLTGVLGIGFGALQCFLMQRAALGERPHKWLYAVKFGLWAAALVVLALLAIPLLLAFVVASTATLAVGTLLVYRRAQKEAR